MLKLALSQLRDQPRRYISVLLAIVVGVTFLASALMVGSSSNASMRNSLGNTYSTADLVIAPGTDGDSYETARKIAAAAGTATEPGPLNTVDGVTEAFAPQNTTAGIQRPASVVGEGSFTPDSDFAVVSSLPRAGTLVPEKVVAGTLPPADSTTEIALDAGTAERFGLKVGDTTMLHAGAREAPEAGLKVTVVALTERSQDPMLAPAVQIRAAEGVVDRINELNTTSYIEEGLDSEAGDIPVVKQERAASYVLIRLDEGTDPDTAAAAVQSALDQQGIDATVRTPDEQVQKQIAAMAGSNVFVYVLAAFAAIALLVTALVISNTFSVLVAQRSRDLALQRALGASRTQIRGAVITEAAVIGVIGSLLGFALAAAIVAGLITVGRSISGFGFLTFGLDPSTVLISLGVGVALTVLASLAPAALATRVSPLEAMRPREDAALGNRAGVVRLVVGGLALLAGSALLIWGAMKNDLVTAVGGGALSFVGVLMLAVLFVPAAVRVAGLVARPAGVPGVMARLNAIRNPGRTASTAAALLIGTTLVAMMLTGGRTAQQQMDTMLAGDFPVDLQVGLLSDDSTPLDPAASESARQRVAAVEGVDSAALLTPAGTTQNGSDVLAGDAEQLRTVVAGLNQDQANRLGQPGHILVPSFVTEPTVTVTGPSGSITLQTLQSSSGSITPVISRQDAEKIGFTGEGSGGSDAEVTPNQLWLATDDQQTLNTVQDLNTRISQAASVSAQNISGSLNTRLLYSSIIDGMLLVVTALLAVSVLIALIGVANTLSLSAIERTRENSLLRALGLTRRGLRGMLALEAVLISGVAALLGCTLGTLYGWLGAQTVLGTLMKGTVWPTVPWWELGLIVLVSVAAGLLASVAPARRATRLSPVQGLATA